MALFRRLFYRKPPDRLLEISERVYVFDCCFSAENIGEKEYRDYLGGVVNQLQDYFPHASFMVFNFRDGDKKSHASDILSEYDMTVMDYPLRYEGCPLLPLEMILHFLKSSGSWLSLEGQHNVLLMHCERGGWPVLAFMLASLLLYRKQYSGEQKTLDMVYKQAPKELLHLLSPLNPQASQLRYLQYISRRGCGSEWPPEDKPSMLECIILSVVPNFDGKGGCRPVVRIYGQDPLTPTDRSSKILFSTPMTKKFVRHYRQGEGAPKINARCRVRGDVVIECIHMDEDFECEEMMFRLMLNTAFIQSDILVLRREEIDVVWNAKDQIPRDFKAEVLFSDFGTAASGMAMEAAAEDDDEMEGASELFFEAEDIFSPLEMHSDTEFVLSKSSLDVVVQNSEMHVMSHKPMETLEGAFVQKNPSYINNNGLRTMNRIIQPFETPRMLPEEKSKFVDTTAEQDSVAEKLITLYDVIAVKEKKTMISSSFKRINEALSPTIEQDSTLLSGNSTLAYKDCNFSSPCTVGQISQSDTCERMQVLDNSPQSKVIKTYCDSRSETPSTTKQEEKKT